MTANITGFNSDQVISVTAGASGIGLCIAHTFLTPRCKVHICDIDSTSVKQFMDTYPASATSVADVSKPDDLDQSRGRYLSSRVALVGSGRLLRYTISQTRKCNRYRTASTSEDEKRAETQVLTMS